MSTYAKTGSFPMSPGFAEKIGRLNPFSDLDEDSLAELIQLMRLCSFHLCWREKLGRGLDAMSFLGKAGQRIYLIEGQLRLEFFDGAQSVIVGGTPQAASPLGGAGRHPVSAQALSDIELLCFDEAKLETVLTWQVMAVPVGLGSTARPAPPEEAAAEADRDDASPGGTDWRMMTGIFAAGNLFDGVFAALPPGHIQPLVQKFEKIGARSGEIIIRQGDDGDYFYLIDSGCCVVSREVGGSTNRLAELGPGETFGEEALIIDSARNATVTMISDGVLRRLSKQDFLALLHAPLLRTVAPEEALQKAQVGAKWIDVRFPTEYQLDGLPCARNIPLNEMRQSAGSLDKDEEYIVYCSTGQRSSAAVFLLSQRGFQAVLLEGGLRAFVRQQLLSNKFRVACRALLG